MNMDDIGETLKKAAQEMLNLRVTTIVGDASYGLDADGRLTMTPPNNPVTSMTTHMDLLQGDISTVIGAAMLTEEYATVRDHHKEMMNDADGIVQRNIDVVKSLIAEIRNL